MRVTGALITSLELPNPVWLQLADSKLLVATRERQIADIKVASVSTQQHRDGEALRSTQLELARVVEREQIGKGQLQATQNALEDALKENAKLKAAQVSVRDWPLCCDTRQLSKACSAVGGVV